MNYINGQSEHIHVSVKPAGKLKPQDVFEVHRLSYMGSLLAIFEKTYPRTKQVLGKSAFLDLVTDFITDYPSKLWNINRYGRIFPAYLKTDFAGVGELARLELIIQDVADLKKHQVVDRSKYVLLDSPDAKVKLASTLTILQPPFRIFETWEGKGDLPEAGQEYLLVYRKGSSVSVKPVLQEQFQVLIQLKRNVALGDALDSVENLTEESVQNLFRFLSSEGLIEDIIA